MENSSFGPRFLAKQTLGKASKLDAATSCFILLPMRVDDFHQCPNLNAAAKSKFAPCLCSSLIA